MNGLFRHLSSLAGSKVSVPTPTLLQPLRMFVNGQALDPLKLTLDAKTQWVVILDYETGGRPGERALINQLCQKLQSVNTKEQPIQCLQVLAKWGASTVQAIELLALQKGKISAIVSLQNFVLGGGEGHDAANKALATLAVPIIKGLRLADVTANEWRVSEEGLRWDSVHYRVAMPELQGVSQPLVLAAMTDATIDEKTGVKLALSKPIDAQVSLLARRVKRWLALQTKANNDKKKSRCIMSR